MGNDWHTVYISPTGSGRFSWKNKAGVTYTLGRETSTPTELSVERDNFYYKNANWRAAKFTQDFVTGPYGEKYYRQSETEENGCFAINKGTDDIRKGCYIRTPILNDWHTVYISPTGSGRFSWKNKAGVTYTLGRKKSTPTELSVERDNFY